MQSRTTRVALVVAAAAVLVVAFLVLRPADDEEEHAPAAAGETRPSDGGAGDGREERRAGPEVPQIELRDGDVVGGVEQIEIETGDRVEFEVHSDAPDEIHVHGYELTERVGPGEPARFSFTADVEGIYDVEAHDIGDVVIAELRVSPS